MSKAKFKMLLQIFGLLSLCLALCACQIDNSETVISEQGTQQEELDVLSVEKALELVRISIGHEDTYIPLRKNLSGNSTVIGDVYSMDVLGDQVAIILLFNYNYEKEELNADWFLFHLESYFIDNAETGAWHTSSLNDFAVNKNTGEVIARLTEDGTPNDVSGSPFWNEAVNAAE